MTVNFIIFRIFATEMSSPIVEGGKKNEGIICRILFHRGGTSVESNRGALYLSEDLSTCVTSSAMNVGGRWSVH